MELTRSCLAITLEAASEVADSLDHINAIKFPSDDPTVKAAVSDTLDHIVEVRDALNRVLPNLLYVAGRI